MSFGRYGFPWSNMHGFNLDWVVNTVQNNSSRMDAVETQVSENTQTIEALIEDYSENYASVRLFGAVGDGVTDDRASIVEALNYLGELGGGVLYFPNGEYYISDTIYIGYSNILIMGNGTSSILKNRNFRLGHYNDEEVRGTLVNIHIRNLKLDGMGIYVEDVVGTSITDMLIVNAYDYGIGLVGSNIDHRSDCFISNVLIKNSGADGVDLKSGFERALFNNVIVDGTVTNLIQDSVGFDIRGNDIILNNCVARNCDDHGFRVRIEATNDVIFNNCIASDNTLDGFRIDRDENYHTILTGCISAGNRYGFRFGNGYARVVNCVARNNTANGIDSYCDSTAMFNIHDCTIENNALDGIHLNGVGYEEAIVKGNNIFNNARFGVYSEASGMSLLMNNNIVRDNGEAGVTTGVGLQLNNNDSDWSVNDNLFTNKDGSIINQVYAIKFGTNTGAGIIDGNIVSKMTGFTNGAIPTDTVIGDNLDKL